MVKRKSRVGISTTMTKKTVLIRNVDGDLWNWFVGYCKQKGKSVGSKIENFIIKIKKGK